MRPAVATLWVVVAWAAFGCASGSPRVTEREISDDRWLDAYDRLLDSTFPVHPAAFLSVQVYKDLPRFVPEDLEFSFSIAFASDPSVRVTPPLLVRAWSAVEEPAVTQLDRVLEETPGVDDAELFARVRQREWLLPEARCPAIAAIAREFDPSSVVVRLPVPSDVETIILHPRVVRIQVEGEHRSLTLRTTDAGDPAFHWGLRAADAVRSCTKNAEPTTWGCGAAAASACVPGH